LGGQKRTRGKQYYAVIGKFGRGVSRLFARTYLNKDTGERPMIKKLWLESVSRTTRKGKGRKKKKKLGITVGVFDQGCEQPRCVTKFRIPGGTGKLTSHVKIRQPDGGFGKMFARNWTPTQPNQSTTERE